MGFSVYYLFMYICLAICACLRIKACACMSVYLQTDVYIHAYKGDIHVVNSDQCHKYTLLHCSPGHYTALTTTSSLVPSFFAHTFSLSKLKKIRCQSDAFFLSSQCSFTSNPHLLKAQQGHDI